MLSLILTPGIRPPLLVRSPMVSAPSRAAAFANGWLPVGGFGTGQNESHTYRVTVGGFSAEGTLLVTGTFDFTHVE